MMKKSFLPESFNFDVQPVEIIGLGSKGLDKTAMVKRASAFDDVIDKLEKKAGFREWYRSATRTPHLDVQCCSYRS